MTDVHVIDSHTGGEPTRVVLAGSPDLGTGSVAARAARFRDEFAAFRTGVVTEPRGSDVWVGALLVPPLGPAAAAGVVFFNNVGVLGMCGHGLIGLIATLAHLGRIAPGDHRVETPVGDVTATLLPDGRVRVRNVPSYRHAADVSIKIDGLGWVTGDIAWGGNWFFLADWAGGPITLANAAHLTTAATAIRRELERRGITGAAGGVIDHIELCGPPADAANDGRNFVLCPGLAFDRSPCGTGTSAKLACLAAAGKLAPGEVWRQEGVVGSVFEASYEPGPAGAVRPSVTGRAWVTATATLHFGADDPFRAGLG